MKEIITGVGKDAPITTNKRGGKQSASPYGFHYLCRAVAFLLQSVLSLDDTVLFIVDRLLTKYP